ncbi:hypothetical protein BASA81_006521 [Batrachochytrium salamandrivorans]|nr:hypothetical protein BASA81_006521 [Batrachochytrium salamandrivorans]
MPEPDLLSNGGKLGVLCITLLHSVLHRFALEVGLGLMLSIVGLVSLLVCSSRAKRTVGYGLVSLGVLLAVWFSPSSPSSFEVEHFQLEQFPPPLHREQLVVSNEDGFFREGSSVGRILLLRGINFGAKTPKEFPITAKVQQRTGKVSFLNRPCQIAECGAHFARLRGWGFTLLRLLVPWEAVEPNAPGEYDVEYLDFLQQLCRLAGQYGLAIIIDPHQDVWSRFSGGDGAPGWTLQAAGFNLDTLHDTNAAVIHSIAMERNESYPTMIWPTNYGKLASATMFTLFFAGNEFAPKTKVNGQPIQDYLQEHYLAAMRQVATRLKDERNVLGFDTLNEPNVGYIGLDDLTKPTFPVPLGLHTSAFIGMQLGAGVKKRVNRFGPRPFVFQDTVWANPHQLLAWRSAEDDVWRNNGVWDFDANGIPQLLRPGHFKLAFGQSFMHRYYVPFVRKFTLAVRSTSHDYVVFAEPAISLLEQKQVLDNAPGEAFDLLGGRFSWAPHQYDGGTLMTKSFHEWFALDTERGTLVFGQRASRELFVRLGATLHRSGQGWPVLVGETGVPMDMPHSAKALDRTLAGFEQSFLSWTLWNYMPDNTNKFGDGWNGEDLSLLANGKPRSGGVLLAAIRPYPIKLAGTPLETWFDLDRGRFFLKVRLFINNHTTTAHEVLETEVFVPKIHFPHSISWEVGGRGSSLVKYVSDTEQLLVWRHDVSPGATSVESNELFVDQWLQFQAKSQ